MTVQKTDRWVGENRLTLPQALAFALRNAQRVPDAQAFATEQCRICVAMGWDFLIGFGQANEESANFTGTWWINRLNAVNIGVTGNPAEDAISPTYSSGMESAQAWAYHLALYLGVESNPIVSGYRHLDPHATNVEQAGYVERRENTRRSNRPVGNRSHLRPSHCRPREPHQSNRAGSGRNPNPNPGSEPGRRNHAYANRRGST